MNTETTTQQRTRRSVPLTEQEMSKLKYLEIKYPIQLDRAEFLGIDRGSLQRISSYGSGNQRNIDKLKQKLKTVKLPAA